MMNELIIINKKLIIDNMRILCWIILLLFDRLPVDIGCLDSSYVDFCVF